MAIDVLLFDSFCGETILTELNRFFYVFLPVQSHINCNTTRAPSSLPGRMLDFSLYYLYNNRVTTKVFTGSSAAAARRAAGSVGGCAMSDIYEKVSATMNSVEREKKVLDFWRREHVFERSVEERRGHPVYTFYDGPPTANGKPHIGHVLTRVIKDMIPRYRTMKGYLVPRKAGWDTHGLPVEIEVEKKLGLDGKEQIEEYGLEPFIRECKESVWKYKGMWEDFSGTVGY